MQSDAFGLEFQANNHPLEFRVDDFDTAQAELKSRGVEFKGETIDSGLLQAGVLRRPRREHLAIHHRYA